MTKNGSNARKARIRTHASKTGATYRQAAQALNTAREKEDKERAERIARTRAMLHTPEDLAEERELYLEHMLAADLPDSVRVCLYALADRLGTGRLIDSRGVSFTVAELAERTGLSLMTVEDGLNLARAHGWITGDFGCDVRLTVPGEDIEMYEWFLARIKQPVRNSENYERMLQQIEEEVAQQARQAAEARAWIEESRARKASAADGHS
ncbi:hypothetical protein [Streptomyces sp. NBC_00147]|uniref:hypothetical protein n=1 Tax=Streptomyces sp. NBC_00147 TaxID=2975667 RepID=UPI002F90DCAF